MRKNKTITMNKSFLYCDSCGKELFEYEDGIAPEHVYWTPDVGLVDPYKNVNESTDLCTSCSNIYQEEKERYLAPYKDELNQAIIDINLKIYKRIVLNRKEYEKDNEG